MPRQAPSDHDDTDLDTRPSKTRLKQEAHELQTLGRELSELPDDRLAAIDMPDALREAILTFRRTKSHEGKRRQLQYVGKQMRAADAGPLREAVDAYKLGSAKDTLRLHETERWRDELVANDEALTRWTQAFPQSDLQRLRSLIRSARKDAASAPEQRSGRGYRELFQFIKPWLIRAEAADEPGDEDGNEDDDGDE